jgi:hypothetical protein
MSYYASTTYGRPDIHIKLFITPGRNPLLAQLPYSDVNFLRVALPFFSIMPTYSEDTLTTALVAYRNGEYTSTRKCAYAFNIPRSMLLDRLSNRTSYIKSYES